MAARSLTNNSHKLERQENVYVIATNNDGADVMRARTKFRQEEMITIPSVITSYNKYMGGVDHCDQYRAYYKVHVGRTGRRWWKYLFWGLFNQALVNAYILWELSTRPHKKQKRSWSLKAFKIAIVHQLVDGFTSRKRTSGGLVKRPITHTLPNNANTLATLSFSLVIESESVCAANNMEG